MRINDVNGKTQNFRVLKLGAAFNLAYRIGQSTDLGFVWHVYMGDLDRERKVCASQFVNFYVALRVFSAKLSRGTKANEYN